MTRDELNRIDLSDPRKALEELATVPSLRERAQAALRVLEDVGDVGDVDHHPGEPPQRCGHCDGAGYLVTRSGQDRECMWCCGDSYEEELQDYEDDMAAYAAIDDARDQARRLLAEVLL